jgi:hypothetical protein
MLLYRNLLVVLGRSFNESEIENVVGRSLKHGKQMGISKNVYVCSADSEIDALQTSSLDRKFKFGKSCFQWK